jgi:protein-tyrosine-phosphatase
MIFPLDSAGTKREHLSITSHGIIAMSASSSASTSTSQLDSDPLDNSHYEQACDQAIAMCDGNLRSTIKALIMANEYLEAELMELQAAISSGCMPIRLADPASNAA